jgi:nucleosome binding factor SPN SPT16 subunit
MRFLQTAGGATGLEFRESSYVFKSGNTEQLRENMVVILSLGLADLEDAAVRASAQQGKTLFGKGL